MANEELIDEYIDRPAFKAETDFAVNEVNRLLASFDSLKKAKTDIASSKGLTDISAAVRQSEKDTQLLLRTQILLANQKKAEIQLDNELLKNARLKEQAADRLIKKELEVAKAKAANAQPEFAQKAGGEDDIANLQKKGEVVNELDRAQADAAISATEFGASQNRSTAAVRAGNAEQQKTVLTAKQLALAKAEGKLLTERETAALKLQVREELAVKGSLEQRRAALIRLNAVYDNQSPQERASAAGQRLQRIIGGLDTQVKTLESSTGRAQRNVGNYGSAFDKVSKGVSSAFGVIRQAAYILPGIGIAGIFGALGGVLEKVITATAFLGEKQTLLNSIYKEGAKSSGEQVSVLTLLKNKLNDINTTQADRLRFVKEYNKIADDGNKLDETQINNLDLINKKIEAQIALIVKRAVAKAAENKLDEQAAKVVEAQLQVSQFEKFKDARKLTSDELKEANKKDNEEQKSNLSQNQKTNSDALSQQSRYLKSRLALNADAVEGQKKYNKARLTLDKEQAELDRQAGLLSPLITADGVSSKDKAAKKAAADNLQALKDITDNEFKEYEIRQKRKISNFERDLASDKVHYLDKIIILKEFYDASKELLERAAAEEKRLAIEKANSEIQKLQEEATGKSPAEVQRINDNIAILEQNLATQLKTINVKLSDDLIALGQTTSDKKVKIDEDYVKTKKDFLDQEIAYEEYTANQILKIRERVKRLDEDARNKELELFKELQNKKIEAAVAAEKFLFSLGDAVYQRQLNNISLQKDQVDKQKDAELAANDARVQSEQDKAANIAIINQRALTQKEQLDRKAKDIELQRARFDRAQQAFEIGIQTIKSIAEIKAKAATLAASGNPLIAALAIKALAQIPLVLATSALAIGALFAQPLPRLFRGKKRGVSVGEAAMVNDHPDGVTSEVIERANGDIEFPQGRNVVTKIGVNDIVHPDKDAWLNAILGAATRDTASGINFKPAAKGDNQLAAALAQQTKLLKQIAGKPVATTHATDRGLVQVMNWGANQIRYVNENTNW